MISEVGALTSGAHPGSHNGQDDAQVIEHKDSGELEVRRLTPLERERLQGFPDGWTAICSDAARNAQTGNAVTAPVVEWIARRLVTYEEGNAAMTSFLCTFLGHRWVLGRLRSGRAGWVCSRCRREKALSESAAG